MPALQKIVHGCLPELVPLKCGTTTIGRGTTSELLILSQQVSKTHARVTCDEQACFIEDLSTNGTLLNGRRMPPHVQQPLRHGDILDIGSVTLVYLDTESAEDLSMPPLEQQPFAVVTARDRTPDDSMKRMAVRAGDRLQPEPAAGPGQLDANKIVASLALSELPLLQLTTTDSVRRLSQVLRLCEQLLQLPEGRRTAAVPERMLQLFPAAEQIAVVRVCLRDEPWQVLAGHCRSEDQPLVLCQQLIRHVAATCEAVLAMDQWREGSDLRPRLSELSRRTVMCVPLRSSGSEVDGVIQMIASPASGSFTAEDLERLVILSVVLAVCCERRTVSDPQEAITVIRNGSRGSQA